MLERRVIILLKYSLNPLNICERNIYPSESDLQSLCLDCGNKVHHEEQFQDLPDNTTNETSKAVLELANSLQLYLPGPGHRPGQVYNLLLLSSDRKTTTQTLSLTCNFYDNSHHFKSIPQFPPCLSIIEQ